MDIIKILAPIAAIVLQLGTNWGGYATSFITGTQDSTLANFLIVGIALIWLIVQGVQYVEKRNNERNAVALERLSSPFGTGNLQSEDPDLSQLYRQYPHLKDAQSKRDK
jgi:hypothetical protein